MLPVSERDRTVATPYDRELTTWHYQDGSVGARVEGVSMPAVPGRYLLSFYRNGDDPVTDALVLLEIAVVERPEILLDGPPRANPGEFLPIVVRGGQNGSDRVEIWRDGALVSWDYSRYLTGVLGDSGAPNPLAAPADVGLYEMVYIRSNAADGPAARQDLDVLVGDLTAEEPDTGQPEQRGDAGPLDPATGPDAAPSDFAAAHACDGPAPCQITDAATGIAFLLPAGRRAEAPIVAPWTASGEAVARVAFRRPLEVPDEVALNPRQWTGGECVAIAATPRVRLAQPARSPDLHTGGRHDRHPRRPRVHARQGDGGGSRLAWRLRVESPAAIVFARSLEIVLPDVAAAVLGMSGACAVTGTDRWIRIGD